MVTDELLTVEAVAARLKVHPETVRRDVMVGTIKGHRPGSTRLIWRISASEVERFGRGEAPGDGEDGDK